MLLDSVQSQANRLEDTLNELWRRADIDLPVITVNFAGVADDVGMVTSLTAPHRIADALLRDSVTADGQLFRLSDVGRSFTDAAPRDASALFRVCPTGLLFGLWDSTGPKGGSGAKFQRSLVSEIIGIDAIPGSKTASRIDPAGIVTRAAEVLVATDVNERWTHDPALAVHEKGKPVKLGDGKVSEVNHSNIPPSIDDLAGGVTIAYASQTIVLSLAGLRKLGFGGAGEPEARTVLCALGLVAVLASMHRGHDLRSRCLLVPRAGQALTLKPLRTDGATTPIELSLQGALELYAAAVRALPDHLRFANKPGQPWRRSRRPRELAHLVRKSRELAAVGTADEGQ